MARTYMVIALAVIFVLVQQQADAGEEARYNGPIIDMHMHAYDSLKGRNPPRPCSPDPCAGAPPQANTEEEVRRLTISAMDRNGIVLGFLSNTTRSSFKSVHDWADAHPRRFVRSAFVCDPADIDLAELEAAFKAGRFTALGEIGSQYCGLAIDDPKLAPLFVLAEKYDLPVLVHSHGTGARGSRFKKFRIDIGRPTRIEEVMVRHPDLRISIEDAGFPFLEDTIALMYRYPTVYGDLSNLSWIVPRNVFYDYLKRLIDAGLGKRLLYGSDQMTWPEVIDESVEAIQSADFLTAEQKADIFYNNGARFLRLSDEEIARHKGR